jgi:hypothetical protein
MLRSDILPVMMTMTEVVTGERPSCPRNEMARLNVDNLALHYLIKSCVIYRFIIDTRNRLLCEFTLIHIVISLLIPPNCTFVIGEVFLGNLEETFL